MNQNDIDDQQRSELIDKHWDINVDHEWWDCTYDEFRLEMQTKGIEVKDINFSGFYSQGDGACFTGIIDMKVFLKIHNLEQEFMGATFFASQNELYATIDRTHSSHYSHEHTVEVNLQEDTFNEYDEGDLRGEVYSQMFTILADEWASLDEAVTAICRSYMKGLYYRLQKEYEALTTDEAIWETIVANDLHVLEAV